MPALCDATTTFKSEQGSFSPRKQHFVSPEGLDDSGFLGSVTRNVMVYIQ